LCFYGKPSAIGRKFTVNNKIRKENKNFRGYDGLVDLGYKKHVRINHHLHFSAMKAHINGIESFWSFTKRRLTQFNGYKVNFHLHLKECEWRWNKDFDSLVKKLECLFFNSSC
jgi:transposase